MKVMVRAYDEDQVDVGWFVFRRHEAPIYDDTSDQASGTRRYHEFGQLGAHSTTILTPSASIVSRWSCKRPTACLT